MSLNVNKNEDANDIEKIIPNKIKIHLENFYKQVIVISKQNLL